jgi:hypothetical protein
MGVGRMEGMSVLIKEALPPMQTERWQTDVRTAQGWFAQQ